MDFSINCELAAALLALFCLLYSLTVRRSQYLLHGHSLFSNQHAFYLMLLGCTIISSLCSWLGESLELNATGETASLQMMLHMGYFIFHTAMPALYALYVMALNGSIIGKTRSFFMRFLLPLAACEFLILCTPWTRWVFYLDDAYRYHRGLLMPMLYLCAGLYVLFGTFFYFKNRKAISNASSHIISALVLISIAGILIQMLNGDLLVETFSEALSFLGFFLTLEDTSRYIDPVTQVSHRKAFDEINQKLLLTDQSYTVLYVHIENLSLYTRLFSVKETDAALQQIADWLSTLVPREQIFARQSQGFLILLRTTDDAAVMPKAETILERFDRPWIQDELHMDLCANVSIIHMPEDAASPEELEKLLEITSEYANRGPVILTADDLEQFKRSLLIERLLGKAIANKSIDVWYQPIWSAETNTIVAAEALARLIDSEYGFIPPDEFIPIAEKNGMIMDLGSIVFEKVCQFIEHNDLKKLGMEYIEINLSMYQFLQVDLEDRLLKIMQSYHVPVEAINLEITESISDSEVPVISQTMNTMNLTGFTFSLDDYGTGYSNIQRLITSDYRNVKIDKSILWKSDVKSSSLLSSLIHTIRDLGMNTIQEGVETREQLDLVVSLGCNMIQGYYFSKPVREHEFVNYVLEYNHICA